MRKALIYIPLSIFALVTLIPFAYMASSAFKPQDVMFNSTFLPLDGLFAIDESTGELKVVDITHLPENELRFIDEATGRSIPVDLSDLKAFGPFYIDQETGDRVRVAPGDVRVAEGVSEQYPLEITYGASAEDISRQTVTVGYGEVDADEVDFMVSALPEINQSLGRVVFEAEPDQAAAAEATAGGEEAKEAVATIRRFEIASGNLRGGGGVAWGLLTDDNFKRLFKGVPPPNSDGTVPPKPTGVWRAIVNSFFFASVSSVLATLGAAMGGYALGKFRFRGRGLIDNTVLAALVIPGALLIAPGYQLLYWFGLLDTYTGLILPGIAPAFGVFLFRQAMITSLPDEMMEAARIDGCGEIKMFFTMALPMVRPMAGAFLLITYLGAWNNFIGPQIILQDPDKYPLAVWISQLRGLYGIDYGLIMAGTLVAIAPVLGLFLLLQKEFIAGLTAGAVKG
ncbi:MAG: carbohydrate ABC transporter permease [Planctomycetota bacterium]